MLKEFGAKLKNALQASGNGPLVLAQDVVKLASEWSKYEADADGLDCDSWLKKFLGNENRGLYWWQRRNDAVIALGEAVRRRLHHEVAFWIFNSIEEAYWSDLTTAIIKRTVGRGGSLLSKQEAETMAISIGARTHEKGPSRDQLIKTIEKLNAKIVELETKLLMSSAAE